MTWPITALAYLSLLSCGVGIGLIVERHMASERRWREEDRQRSKVPPLAPPRRNPLGTEIVNRISFTTVAPGSLLVLESDQLLSREQCDRLRAELDPQLAAHGCKCVVLSRGVRLAGCSPQESSQ